MEVIQSTKQAFYFIENIMINGMPIQTGDWVLAYHDNTLVGAGKWGAPYSEVPAMGNDGMAETDRYCKTGSEVRLKILQENTGEYFQVLESLPNWQDNGLFTLGRLTAREMPAKIMIESAYPNPFNPVTHISFGIDTDAYVQVKVFDITGKEIATLADGTYFSGYHNLIWNADNFASGMYFVRLEAGNFVQIQKLLLLK